MSYRYPALAILLHGGGLLRISPALTACPVCPAHEKLRYHVPDDCMGVHRIAVVADIDHDDAAAHTERQAGSENGRGDGPATLSPAALGAHRARGDAENPTVAARTFEVVLTTHHVPPSMMFVRSLPLLLTMQK